MVFLTVALTFWGAPYYVWCAWNRRTSPSLAAWILMLLMIVLSVWMYWHSPTKSLTGNVGVLVGAVNIVLICIGVVVIKIRDHTLMIEFDLVQKMCLAGGVFTLAFWSVTRSPLVSYTLVQFIALCAYLATAAKLWRAERVSEPLLFWVVVFITGLTSLYPGIVKRDIFAWIFLGRAIPCSAVLVFLIIRIKAKMRGERVGQYLAKNLARAFNVLVANFV